MRACEFKRNVVDNHVSCASGYDIKLFADLDRFETLSGVAVLAINIKLTIVIGAAVKFRIKLKIAAKLAYIVETKEIFIHDYAVKLVVGAFGIILQVVVKADDTDVFQKLGTNPDVFPFGFFPELGRSIVLFGLHYYRLVALAVCAIYNTCGNREGATVDSASFKQHGIAFFKANFCFKPRNRTERFFFRAVAVYIVSPFGNMIRSSRHSVAVKFESVGRIKNIGFHSFCNLGRTFSDSFARKISRLIVKSGDIILCAVRRFGHYKACGIFIFAHCPLVFGFIC